MVFFDTPVSRAWVTNFHTHPYTVETDYNTTTGVSVVHVHVPFICMCLPRPVTPLKYVQLMVMYC